MQSHGLASTFGLEATSLTAGFGKDFADVLGRISKHIKSLPSLTGQLTSNCQKLANLKLHLHDIREVQRALTSFPSTLESSLHALERQYSDVFVHEHYTRLPDEIFAIIFEFASFDDLAGAIRLSQVCRRFRAIALSNPTHWTNLRPKIRLQLQDFQGIIARSAASSCGITLDLDSDNICNYRYDRNAFMKSLMKLTEGIAPRIHFLSLDLKAFEGIESLSAFSHLCLPSLFALKVAAPEYVTWNPTSQPVYYSFYSNWNVPSLRTIHAAYCFPCFSSRVLSQITTFSFLDEESRFLERSQWTMNQFARRLSQLNSVEVLEIDVDFFGVSDNTPLSLVWEIGLDTLRSLTLKLQTYSLYTVRSIFAFFDNKNLQSISVKFGETDEILQDLPTLLESVWRTDHLAKLAHFELRTSPTYHDVYEEPHLSPRVNILRHFLRGCPALRTIHLECPDGDSQFFGFSNRLAAIRLTNCHLFDDGFYGDELGPAILYEMEHHFERSGELVDGCLVVDGSRPLKEARVVKTDYSDRNIYSVRDAFAERNQG